MAFLINKFLPEWNYHEYHEKEVNAPAKACFLATKDLDMKRSFITVLLMKLRGLPTSDLRFNGFLKNMCFKYLEENPYTEFVIDASQENIRIFWNFYFKAVEENKTVVSTETRILCLTEKSRTRFSVYWFFVRPFSGLIRIEILRLIKKSAESHPV